MPTLEIKLTVPEGTIINILGADGSAMAPDDVTGQPDTAAVLKYWREYLSDNGRRIYEAAARIENFRGPGYTLEDIAQNLSITYDSAKSMHRTSGRTAKKWYEDTSTEAPITLLDTNYGWNKMQNGMRTTYALPSGIADLIEGEPTNLGTPGV